MDAEFWHERWRTGQIGFHQAAVNPLLVKHWPALGMPEAATVFVPLSGKSLDLVWIRERGHPVVGVELSVLAVQEFFETWGKGPTVAEVPGRRLTRWEADGIRLFVGDFFDLRAEDLADVKGVYDRAALVALPPDLRRAYAKALTENLPPSVVMLLLCFEARPENDGGPPFAFGEAEVRALYEPAFSVTLLERGPFAEPPAAARARGVEAFRDVVYVLGK